MAISRLIRKFFAVQGGKFLIKQKKKDKRKQKQKQNKTKKKNLHSKFFPRGAASSGSSICYKTIFRVLYIVKILIQPLLKAAKAPVVNRAFLQKWIVLRFIYILIL